MKLIYKFTACYLMKVIDILRYDALEHTHPLQLRERVMGWIRGRIVERLIEFLEKRPLF